MPIAVRLPEDLDRAIRDLAKEEERSLNNMIVRLLREALRAKGRLQEVSHGDLQAKIQRP